MNCDPKISIILLVGMIIVPLILIGLHKVTKNEDAQEFVMFFFLLSVIGTPLFMGVFL